ncbi:hypothetical protein lbkm_1914 [Lachnospiraceae bacterium KM106-2]|nr:hypothetical protein lbkm_1914 [Lachnospiraceae bacterium KM106-2]
MYYKKILRMFGCVLLSTMLITTGCSNKNNTTKNQTEATTDSETNSKDEKNTSLMGKITKIDGKKITIALVENQGGSAPDQKPAGQADSKQSSDTNSSDTNSSDAKSSDTKSNTSESKTDKGEQPPEKPSGDNSSGQAPEMKLSGETKVVKVTDDTKYTINGESGKLSDLKLDDMIQVTIVSEKVTAITSGMSGQPGSDNGQQQTTNVETKGEKEFTTDATEDANQYESSSADVSSVVVSDGAKVSLSNANVKKTGDSSNTENSEFYGLNAALLAKEKSTLTLKGSTVNTSAAGANAVFATGTDAVVNLDTVMIHTTKDSSRGLDATYGGTINAKNVTIQTEGAHCAAVATDRGEGTVTVKKSKLNTKGEGSPCIYSTGKITAQNSTGTATGSGIAVVEGKNSITISDSKLSGAATGRATGGIDDAGVMIYQSFSGDAGTGTGTFTAKNSSLSILSSSDQYKTAPMFFVTNTDAVINLNNTSLVFGSGVLLNATGNSGEWGTEGSNGGTVTLNATNQTLEGNITADKISTVKLTLKKSTLAGAINSDNKAKEITVSLDKDSSWNVTKDSYVTVLTNKDKECTNIKSNGHTIYYDSSNSANSWLNGETISLSDGGKITPMK